MGNRIILNGTSYFGRGARENVITELRNRNFTKALVVTDKKGESAIKKRCIRKLLKIVNYFTTIDF